MSPCAALISDGLDCLADGSALVDGWPMEPVALPSLPLHGLLLAIGPPSKEITPLMQQINRDPFRRHPASLNPLQGEYSIGANAAPAMLNSLMYKLSYWDFDKIMTSHGKPTG